MAGCSLTSSQHQFLKTARVGTLATVDGVGQPHVVPVVFALDGGRVYTPIDGKPKSNLHGLRRLRNIRKNSKTSLLISRYEEDWTHLGFLILRGTAMILKNTSTFCHSAGEEAECQKAEMLLREKYPQYETVQMGGPGSLFIRITFNRAISWGMI